MNDAPTVPRLLLVDDTPANLIALAAVLAPLGAEMVEARSGKEALALIERGGYAAVLLDVQMPEMDGFEVAARLRASDKGRNVPIVFLTAIHFDERYARKGYDSGAADYITKPFDVGILRARVKAFLDVFRQRDGVHREEVQMRTRERDEAVRRLVAFERISTSALASVDVDVFIRELLGVFMEAADSADSAAILLREGSSFGVSASVGVGDDVALRFAQSIAATAKPILIRDPALLATGVRAVYGIPLLYDEVVIGVAHIGSSRADDFSVAEKRMLAAMAERAAWAVAQRRKRERFEGILSAAPAVVTILRVPDYVYDYQNATAKRLFGGRDIVGQSAIDLGMPREMLSVLDSVATKGERMELHDLAIRRDWKGEGRTEERRFDSTFQPLRDTLGRVEAILAFSIDVTDQHVARERERAARAEAEVANRAKDDFLATVSHELRTPLNAILGWAVIARRQATTPQLERALAIIERNAQAQTRIIEDVLDISRIISGKLRLEISSTDVADAIAGAVETVRPGAEGKGVELVAEVEDVGTIAADADRIKQVVWNVLANAIKFTPAGGRVTLHATKVGARVVIRVSDTGQGIAPEFLPHLFEPFRQGDGSTTRRHGGLGLGLAIVREIIQAHGGTIEAESAGRGKGATLRIELPDRAVHVGLWGRGTTARDAMLAPPAADPSLGGLSILVVDDEEDARELLRDVLEAHGARVAVAGSAREVLARLGELLPDVLVSDIGMPEMDGFGLLEEIRRLPDERGGRTPAIALTAYTRAEDGRRAFAAGFQVHVAKPVDPRYLVAVIASVAGRAEMPNNIKQASR